MQRRQLLHLLGGGLVAPFVGCGHDESQPGPAPDPDAGKPWWLRGNYAPVPELEAFDLEIIGALPAALDGLYLRNGPNPQSGVSDHWFLGDGMVHGVRLEAGRASFYRSRYVATELLQAPDDDSLGPPQPGENPSNTALVHHAGRLLSLCEIGLPYELDSELATKGTYDFGGKLQGAMTAHPKIDPQTGELWFIGYNLLSASVDVHAVDATGALVRTERVMLPSPVMMHDFQLTPNFVVLLDLPIVFDIDLAIEGASFPFRWAPENGARLGLMPRNATAPVAPAGRWFEIDPCYVFHTLNAYEDGDRVVLDVIRYSEMWAAGVDDFSGAGNVSRYTLDLARGGTTLDQLDDRQVEMPRIDPRLQGTRQRYAYAMAAGPMGNEGDGRSAILKYDFSAGSAAEHRLPAGMLADEPIFVPAAGGAEDDGWLIAYAFDGAAKKSELHVLDARDLSAPAVARVRLPSRVPFGFHGLWLPR